MEILRKILKSSHFVCEDEINIESGANGSCFLVNSPEGGHYMLKLYKENSLLKSVHEIKIYKALHNRGGSEYFFNTERHVTDNEGYLKMSTFRGKTLREFVKPDTDIKVIIDRITELCRAVREMHRASILHLDLKPANIYVSENENRIMILDMGSAIEKRKKTFEEIMKSEGYLSTAQFSSQKLRHFKMKLNKAAEYPDERDEAALCELEGKIDESDDIYALICCLFYALTGKYFRFWLQEKVDYNEEEEIHESLRGRVPEYIEKRLTDLFYTIVLPGKEYNAKMKYGSADELIEELEIIKDILEKKGYHCEIVLQYSREMCERYADVIDSIDADLLTEAVPYEESARFEI